MRLFYITVAIFFGGLVSSQTVYIPDANFEALLISADATNGIAQVPGQGLGESSVIDLNHNGEIEVDEALLIEEIDVRDSQIADLTGIRAFENLHTLWCQGNSLTTLDVSGMTNLHYLFCWSNQLTQINWENTILTWVNCRDNLLTSLDITQATHIFQFDCSHNFLTSLDLSPIFDMVQLDCSYNQLNSLVFTTQFMILLDCSHNSLTYLDISSSKFYDGDAMGYGKVSDNPLVTLKACYPGSYGSLYIENCPQLQNVSCIAGNTNYFTQLGTTNGYSLTVDNSCALSSANFDSHNSFVVYPNPADGILYIKQTAKIYSVTIYNALGQALITVPNPNEPGINISSLSTGAYFIKVESEGGNGVTKFIKN